ncbi:Adenylosuccinate synthetase [Borrelia duttonii CR2A]|uniref:Adenylosuccinate synthetase n=1 Tax=Borrelia duttonii CR2A TaxID=1432657 RepID=W6THL7_9SPIR|nr:Adenylosuccinate synthetase [Borrelia duttonii CR2A]
MLDIEHGTFPFVTSSNTLITAAAGCGIPISKIKQKIGIIKSILIKSRLRTFCNRNIKLYWRYNSRKRTRIRFNNKKTKKNWLA